MSYNPNFYNNFRGNNSTFQHSPKYLVRPHLPPPYCMSSPETPSHYVPLPPPFVPRLPNADKSPSARHFESPSHYVPLPPPFVPRLPNSDKPPTPRHFVAPPLQPPRHFVPPPPQPPPFFIPSTTPTAKREKADQDFLSTFDSKISEKELTQISVNRPTISGVREEIYNMLLLFTDMYDKEKHLTENINTLTEEEWSSHMKQVEENKALINKGLSLISGPCMDMQRKLLAKRSAKRLRLKRLHLERKREKEERIKELKERSRKIDENLQKIKDDINKAKQEAEETLQADIVLKEVLRKKSDAKKCLTKLDAVMKLRKARQNTATGRGEYVSETETTAFNSHIDKLKSLWARKLILYEKEEGELRLQLKEDWQLSTQQAQTEQNVASNLAKWRETLFGGPLPQVDFGGDVARFVGVRSQWDCYISSEGTGLPIGWVPPAPWTDKQPA